MLTLSESGRPVPLLRVPGGESNARLVVTARHHACEASASLVLEGLILEAIDRRAEGMVTPELLVVPLVDIDGVELGDQGKGRVPHDHNRDYGEATRFRSSFALRERITSSDAPTACIDLHTPGLRGPMEERCFLIASDEPEHQAMIRRLAYQIGPPGMPLPVVVFAEGWNRRHGGGRKCFTAWARSVPAVCFDAIIEYPNAINGGRPVTAEAARTFGRSLYAAVTAMLRGGSSTL
jgi:hypothetical protein